MILPKVYGTIWCWAMSKYFKSIHQLHFLIGFIFVIFNYSSSSELTLGSILMYESNTSAQSRLVNVDDDGHWTRPISISFSKSYPRKRFSQSRWPDLHWTWDEVDSVVMTHLSLTLNENILGQKFLLSDMNYLITGNYNILEVVIIFSHGLFTPLFHITTHHVWLMEKELIL